MTNDLTSTVALLHRRTAGRQRISRTLHGLFDLLGGVERFVHPGMMVLLKPDLRFAADESGKRHVALITEVARILANAGAYVIVADSPFLDGTLVRRHYRRLGLTGAADAAGFCLVDLEAAGTEAVALEKRVLYVATVACEADLVVNIPRLRPHVEFGLSGAIENVVGLLPGFQKVALLPGGGTRAARLSALVDLYAAVAPGLTILDGLETRGPFSTSNRQTPDTPFLAAAADGVALDAITAESAGLEPECCEPIRMAAEAGLGIGWPEGIRQVGDSWQQLGLERLASEKRSLGGVPDLVAGLIGPFIWSRPVLNRADCDCCGVCVKNCPTKALRTVGEPAQPTLSPQLCIGCHRCSAICPQRAVEQRQSRLATRLAASRRRNCDF